MGRSRWAAFAAVATIMLSACSGAGGTTSAAGGLAEDPNGPGSVRAAQSFEELSKALDLNVPGAYMLQPDEVGDTGPSDLEKAVRDDGGADAREFLTRTGFVRGYQRMWKGADSDEVVTYVYQFADHAGALEYTRRVSAVAAAEGSGVTVDMFFVPGIDGALGVNVAAVDVTGSATSSVTFTKGPYSVEVVVTGSSPAGLEAIVTALAEEQYARL